jgi:hypothetical protein
VFWFFTSAYSTKIRQLDASANVNLAYADRHARFSSASPMSLDCYATSTSHATSGR